MLGSLSSSSKGTARNETIKAFCTQVIKKRPKEEGEQKFQGFPTMDGIKEQKPFLWVESVPIRK